MATTDLYCDDTTCEACGATPSEYVCDGCGVRGNVTDCGHMAQPRPIAADGHKSYCDECSEERAERKATGGS